MFFPNPKRNIEYNRIDIYINVTPNKQVLVVSYISLLSLKVTEKEQGRVRTSLSPTCLCPPGKDCLKASVHI